MLGALGSMGVTANFCGSYGYDSQAAFSKTLRTPVHSVDRSVIESPARVHPGLPGAVSSGDPGSGATRFCAYGLDSDGLSPHCCPMRVADDGELIMGC